MVGLCGLTEKVGVMVGMEIGDSDDHGDTLSRIGSASFLSKLLKI